MRPPQTADERERRFVQYVLTLNKGQIAEVRLRRLNRIANFRKALMQIIEQLIEERAEDLAAAMLLEHAPERPMPEWREEAIAEGRLPLPPKKRGQPHPRMPIWIRKRGEAARGRG